ncbi:hypothetical protein B0H16DRAFT_1757499 [Mycena metata]|uniref:F-box domain-containing protein n=1 Tax=Mycena metata TaxID=1033252 RepID=A0AAD7IDU7_9AGAR|nr:hypothetical protein B0H16DRAFT_1757499 [Mycena metata]
MSGGAKETPTVLNTVGLLIITDLNHTSTVPSFDTTILPPGRTRQHELFNPKPATYRFWGVDSCKHARKLPSWSASTLPSQFILPGMKLSSRPSFLLSQILPEIFVWALPPSTQIFDRASYNPSAFPWNLTYVCRRWCQIAIATPECWSLLPIKCTKFRPVQRETQPVSPESGHSCKHKFSALHFGADYGVCAKYQTELFALLLEYSPRWEQLYRCADPEFFRLTEGLGNGLPRLCRMSITLLGAQGFVAAEADAVVSIATAPSMRELSISLLLFRTTASTQTIRVFDSLLAPVLGGLGLRTAHQQFVVPAGGECSGTVGKEAQKVCRKKRVGNHPNEHRSHKVKTIDRDLRGLYWAILRRLGGPQRRKDGSARFFEEKCKSYPTNTWDRSRTYSAPTRFNTCSEDNSRKLRIKLEDDQRFNRNPRGLSSWEVKVNIIEEHRP